MFLTFIGGTAMQMWRDAGTNMNTFGGTAGSAHVEAQEDEVRSHSNAEMTYHGGRFELEPGQALVVTVHEPDKPFLYWGLDAHLAVGGELRLPLRHDPSEQQDGHRSPDGSWRMVIAPTDPGWRTGSTPGAGCRATCWCAGSWPTVRRTRRPRWSTSRTSPPRQ